MREFYNVLHPLKPIFKSLQALVCYSQLYDLSAQCSIYCDGSNLFTKTVLDELTRRLRARGRSLICANSHLLDGDMGYQRESTSRDR